MRYVVAVSAASLAGALLGVAVGLAVAFAVERLLRPQTLIDWEGSD